LNDARKLIRLIVLDIDGVLTAGEAQPLDLVLLDALAGLNRRARQDRNLPPVTLCTGRPAPYVEVMLQAIDGRLPGIYENGAGLYAPQDYQFLPHPDLGDGSTMRAVRDLLEAGLVRPGFAYFQPGKDHTLTLFPHDPHNLGALADRASEALDALANQVELVYSVACLNVLPRGTHKGKGIEFLSAHTGIPPGDMLGVGDSDVDLPFLAMVGRSAAPANANPAVRQAVQYVSPRERGAGVRDILAHFQIPLD
jgi:HAD superfamily hydrolase (TIGR01484 family)